MPITGVTDLQHRSQTLGEIRIGDSKPIPGKNGRQPLRLEMFRFTTPVETTADEIAAKLGGTPQPWDRRRGYWVVDTDHPVTKPLDVWVPPRGRAVDSYMELWDEKRKCQRRCTGIVNILNGQPCSCPQPKDRNDPAEVARAAFERKRLAALGKACKPITRMNLALPWLPGIVGVWRVNTTSANAAVETADAGDLLERARGMEVYLPALFFVHWRPGQDGHPYPVPMLRPRPSAEQLAELPAGMDGMLAQLHGGTGPLALTSGAPAEATDPEPPQAEPASAQEVADQIALGIPLAQSREDVGKLINRAKVAQALDLEVWYAAEPGDAETQETLRDLLDTRWWELPGPPKPANRRRQGAAAEAHAEPSQHAPADDTGSLFGDDPEWEAR